MVAGFCAAGMDVFLLGPIPTPAVAMLARSLRADHRRDDLGLAQSLLRQRHQAVRPRRLQAFRRDRGAHRGAARRGHRDRAGRPGCSAAPSASTASTTATSSSPSAPCRAPCRCRACGSSSIAPMAPPTRWRPRRCGNSAPRSSPSTTSPTASTSTRNAARRIRSACQKKVHEVRADIGIALDGDADRMVIVDENGAIVDGDQIMALIAESWHQSRPAGRRRRRRHGHVQSRARALPRRHGLQLHRTKVGDRYVVEHMRAHGLNVGGEQSGHIVLSDFSTTGDGLVSALQVLACIKRLEQAGQRNLPKKFEPVPQVLKNVRFSGGKPLESAPVKAAIEDARNRLGEAGRLVIRPSGTEPSDPRHGRRRRPASWSRPSSTTSSASFRRRAAPPDPGHDRPGRSVALQA